MCPCRHWGQISSLRRLSRHLVATCCRRSRVRRGHRRRGRGADSRLLRIEEGNRLLGVARLRMLKACVRAGVRFAEESCSTADEWSRRGPRGGWGGVVRRLSGGSPFTSRLRARLIRLMNPRNAGRPLGASLVSSTRALVLSGVGLLGSVRAAGSVRCRALEVTYTRSIGAGLDSTRT